MSKDIPEKQVQPVRSGIHSVLDDPKIQQKIQQESNISNIPETPPEEQALEHLVGTLAKENFTPKKIAKTFNDVLFLKEKWTAADIALVHSRLLDRKKDSFGLTITESCRSFIESTEGEFSLRDAADFLGILKNNKEKNKLSTIMGRLIDEKIIERTGKRNGIFRRVMKDITVMNFAAATEETENLWLPFGLHKMVEIHAGNIIILMGEPNSGKTALCLNIIRYNMDRYQTHYFNCEMGSTELKKRLKNFDDIPIGDWKFNAYERSDNFEDVIVPGKGKLNVIDFVEIHDEFWKIGAILKKIHEKLEQGIAVVCIQKDIGRDLGRGGVATIEKPRLALALRPGACKIVKAKSWKGHENPNGKMVKYKLAAGCWLHQSGEWYTDPGKGRK